MIKFNCNSCSQKISAPEEFAGTVVECPLCDFNNTIPEPDPIIDDSILKFFCPFCEQKLSCTRDLVGSSIDCPACAHNIEVPNDQVVHNDYTPDDSIHEDLTEEQESTSNDFALDALMDEPYTEPPEKPTDIDEAYSEPQVETVRKKSVRNTKPKTRIQSQRSNRSRVSNKPIKKSNRGKVIALLAVALIIPLLTYLYLSPSSNKLDPLRANKDEAQVEMNTGDLDQNDLQPSASKIDNLQPSASKIDNLQPSRVKMTAFSEVHFSLSKGETQASEGMIKELKPFMEKYCITCHNEEKEKGGLRLDTLNYQVNEHESVYEWQDVLDVLNAGEMPPKKEPLKPHNDEISKVIAQITDRLVMAKRRLASTGGQIKMRHLNKREYFATIKDLFGFEPQSNYLYDDAAPHFDTNGNDQFFTSSALENYLEIGEKIALDNLKSYSKPIKKTTTTVKDDYYKACQQMEKQMADALAKMKQIEAGATYQEMGFKDQGVLNLMKNRYPGIINEAKAYLAKPEHKFGSTEGGGARAKVVGGQKYRITITAGSLQKTSIPIEIDLKIMSMDYGRLALKPTSDKTQSVEVIYSPGPKSKTARIRSTLVDRPGVYVKSISVTGPLKSETSFAEKLFRPILSEKNVSTDKASQAIKTFAERAFRYQQGNDDFINALIDRFKRNQQLSKDKTIENLAKSFSLILTSPSFLYIAEKNNGHRKTLSQHEYAIRMAYFLWGGPPDDELYKIAKTGKLYDLPVLTKQFNRMLNSSKSNYFLTSFINQWTEMSRFDQIDLPKEFEGNFRRSARAELSEFFKVLVHENHPVDNLIDSDFAVINKVLAEHYDLADDFKNIYQDFVKVNLKPSHKRGGLLGQAAFLIAGTSGERTSPTIRGTLVRKMLLNDPAPEPPANVPEIEDTKDGVVSVKELVEHHKNLPQCSSCHNKIDPIGLGLENFDLFGRWRNEESLRVGLKKKKKMRYKKLPLDTNGYLSENEKFSDFEGLQKALLNNRGKLAQSLYSSMLSYGIGRDIEFVDQEDIQQNLHKLAKKRFPARDMLFNVINSKTFKTK